MLRIIQAEYSVPLKRQVNTLQNLNFDAAFKFGGILHFMEVNYAYHKIAVALVLQILDRIIGRILRQCLSNVAIEIVIVYEQHEDFLVEDNALSEIIQKRGSYFLKEISV